MLTDNYKKVAMGVEKNPQYEASTGKRKVIMNLSFKPSRIFARVNSWRNSDSNVTIDSEVGPYSPSGTVGGMSIVDISDKGFAVIGKASGKITWVAIE